MGIFSKIKNTMTGGWAKVFVECPGGSRGQDIPVTVKVSMAGNPIQIDRVYLKIRSQECIDVLNHKVRDSDTPGDTDTVNIRKRETTYTSEVNLAGSQELQANQEYSFEGVISIPENLPAVYRGKYARHVWEIQAGLDMKGNDPDSDWVEINIT